MKKIILFLALIGFLAGSSHAAVVMKQVNKMTQVYQNDDPPKASDIKDNQSKETSKTPCCDNKGTSKSCCDDKKPAAKSCCDKGPNNACKPASDPKK